MRPFAEELEYHIALNDIQDAGIDKKQWLKDNFLLYKTTLIYPIGLPPIKICNLEKRPVILAFHKTYREILEEFEYEFDNNLRALILK